MTSVARIGHLHSFPSVGHRVTITEHVKLTVLIICLADMLFIGPTTWLPVFILLHRSVFELSWQTTTSKLLGNDSVRNNSPMPTFETETGWPMVGQEK
ncbi:hypothetical protein BT63DRAFT_115909 [Microthyrium microscopicum]|uniref:Uncharacterized protein n=1 Tax=Microthyrium microscopicum TaxID=703497 RepID=A0A6A6TV44_9PEZI|nr:hypothetical protein BT63DRAFT_115909 [Microthyrium microscopicum]